MGLEHVVFGVQNIEALLGVLRSHGVANANIKAFEALLSKLVASDFSSFHASKSWLNDSMKSYSNLGKLLSIAKEFGQGKIPLKVVSEKLSSDYLDVAQACREAKVALQRFNDVATKASNKTIGLISRSLRDTRMLPTTMYGENMATFIKIIEKSGSDAGVSIENTMDGGFVFAGSTSPPNALVTTKGLKLGENWQALVVKLNATGNISWARTLVGGSSGALGAYGFSIKEIPWGERGYVLTGVICDQPNCDVKTGHQNIFMVRIHANGTYAWGQVLSGSGGTNRLDEARSVQMTSDRSFVLTGKITGLGPASEADILVAKAFENGTFSWANILTGSGSGEGYSILEAQDKGFVITGVCSSNLMVAKVNETGDVLWARTYGGSASGHGTSIIELSDKSLVFTGYVSNFGADSDAGLAVVKVNEVGQPIWATVIEGSTENSGGPAMQKTNDDKIVVAGSIDSKTVVAKIDAAGKNLWVNQILNVATTSFPDVEGLQVLKDDSIVLIGTDTSQVEFPKILVAKLNASGWIDNCSSVQTTSENIKYIAADNISVSNITLSSSSILPSALSSIQMNDEEFTSSLDQKTVCSAFQPIPIMTTASPIPTTGSSGSTTTSPSNNNGLIIGFIVGGVVLLGGAIILMSLLIKKKCCRGKKPIEQSLKEPLAYEFDEETDELPSESSTSENEASVASRDMIRRPKAFLLAQAVEQSKVEAIENLLSIKVNIDTRLNRGCTALHLAAMQRQVQVVTFLLRMKADVQMLNEQNETAFDIAMQKQYSDVLNALAGSRILRVWKGKKTPPGSIPSYQPVAIKDKGCAPGFIARTDYGKQWVMKLGWPEKNVRVSETLMSTRGRNHRRSEVMAVKEKVAADLYALLSMERYYVAKHRLAILDPVNDYSMQHRDMPLLLEEFDRGRRADRVVRECVHIASKWVDGYQNLNTLRSCLQPLNEQEQESFTNLAKIPFGQGQIPEEVEIEGKLVPLVGLVELLAVARLLGDTDVLGGNADNAGYVVERDAGGTPIAARVVKIDAGEAFSFNPREHMHSRLLQSLSALSEDSASDKKDIQFANQREVQIKWQLLSETQKNRFIAVFKKGLAMLRKPGFLDLLIRRRGLFDKARSAGKRLITDKMIEGLIKRFDWYLKLQERDDVYGLELATRATELAPQIAAFNPKTFGLANYSTEEVDRLLADDAQVDDGLSVV